MTEIVKGEGYLIDSVPDGTGAIAPGISSHTAIFQIGVHWLIDNGCNEKSVRSLLGGAEKHLGSDGAWKLISECITEKPIEPMSWIAAALNSQIKAGKKIDLKMSDLDNVDYFEGVSPNGQLA